MTDNHPDHLQKEHLETLQQRYEQVLQEQQYDALLVSSGAAPMRYADDQAHHHQGYGPFLHWTGLAGVEHGWLLIRPGRKPVLWLYTPVDFWHATPDLPAEPLATAFDVHGSHQKSAPDLPGEARLAVVGDPALISGVAGEQNPPALLAAMDQTRIHKTSYEMACIGKANEMASRGHEAAKAAFLAGASEFDISLAYQAATFQREVDAPYHSIIGLNEHAATLHYQHYDTRLPAQPRSLLIDAGCRYRGYCSDITRTTAAPDERHFMGLIAGLEALQQRLCKAVAPGVDYVKLHMTTHQGIAALLSAAGIIRGISDEAAVEQGVTSAFFPHGLGHFLGVQVHDVGGKPRPSPAHAPMLRLTHTLEPAMVLTIEPGLYFIPFLLGPLLAGDMKHHLNAGLIDELRGCGGIRIEDNLAVTETSARNLTRPWLP
ncbi:Xaa-Pro dipeptidase [Marinobacter sp.]|uniref:Xaa-Pro dipeptidase n=1 Tax=Marinobacter sp. TaxID=50741 RepID=UPI00384B567E